MYCTVYYNIAYNKILIKYHFTKTYAANFYYVSSQFPLYKL